MNEPNVAEPSIPAWPAQATPTRTAAQRLQAFANSRAGLAVLFVFLFLAAWIPRTLELDRFVTADEHRWITRSANFAYALSHGDLLHTYQREHPAVTTTWLGALGVITAMPDYPEKAPGYFDAMREDWGIWVRANTDVEPITMLAWGRTYTVFVIALILALAFFPLRRLFGTPAAVLANLFVAWSPMAIAFSRQVQPDGLHAMFMYAALVFFLGWLYAGLRWRDLVASGILMGLGWLTKTPVLFLAPIGGVLVATGMVAAAQGGGERAVGAPTAGQLCAVGRDRQRHILSALAGAVDRPHRHLRQDVQRDDRVHRRPQQP